MTLRSRSRAEASSQKPNSSVHLFSDAFSIQNSQSLSIQPSNAASQPSRERNRQFNFQDGEFLPWKACLQCSCVDVRGDARFTLWKHARMRWSRSLPSCALCMRCSLSRAWESLVSDLMHPPLAVLSCSDVTPAAGCRAANHNHTRVLPFSSCARAFHGLLSARATKCRL